MNDLSAPPSGRRLWRLSVAGVAVAALAVTLAAPTAGAAAKPPPGSTIAAPAKAATAKPLAPYQLDSLTVTKRARAFRSEEFLNARGRRVMSCVVDDRWQFVSNHPSPGVRAKQMELLQKSLRPKVGQAMRTSQPAWSPYGRYDAAKASVKRFGTFRGGAVDARGNVVLLTSYPVACYNVKKALAGKNMSGVGTQVPELTSRLGVSWWKAIVAETAGSLAYTLVYAGVLAGITAVFPEIDVTAAIPLGIAGCLGGFSGRLLYNRLLGLPWTPNLAGSATACVYAALEGVAFGSWVVKMRKWIQGARLGETISREVPQLSNLFNNPTFRAMESELVEALDNWTGGGISRRAPA